MGTGMTIDTATLEALRAHLRRAASDEFLMECAIEALARQGASASLAALCDGHVSLQRLFAIAPREHFDKMLDHMQRWINVYAAGEEIVLISSPRESLERSRELFEACRNVVEALEAHGVVRIGDYLRDGHTQFAFHVIEEPSARAFRPNPVFARVLAQPGPRHPVCVRFIGADRALSGSRDATMTLWDLGSGHALRTFHGHADTVWSIACDADGKRAVTASGDRTMRLWDLAR